MMCMAELKPLRARRAGLVALALGLFLGAGIAGAAGVYKWTDADGKVHFTDKPPPDVKAETVRTNTSHDEHTADRLNALKERADENYEARQKRKEEAVEAAQVKRDLRARCEAAQNHLRELESSTRRQVVNEKGEREFLEETKRQQWMSDARKEIAETC